MPAQAGGRRWPAPSEFGLPHGTGRGRALDTPLSITALDENTLIEKGVLNLQSLYQAVPDSDLPVFHLLGILDRARQGAPMHMQRA